MNKIQKVGKLFLLLSIFSSLLSCTSNDDAPEPASGNISEIIANNPDLSMLKSALDRAGLTATLAASGSMTLLAPNNTAFTVFLANANYTSIDEIPVPTLKQVLLNHVVGSRLDESLLRTLAKNYTETLADGPVANTNLALFFDATTADIVFNGEAKIKKVDIPATNGLVHIIDAVLNPPTLATFIKANDAFSELNTALTTATPGTNFMFMLSGTALFTIFAPPDAAIDDLLDSNPSWSTVNDIDEAYLTSVLQHHIINGNLRSSDISDNQTAASLEGDLLTFSTANGQIDITDGSGNSDITVVVANIQASNGVLHAIEKVLLPDTSN